MYSTCAIFRPISFKWESLFGFVNFPELCFMFWTVGLMRVAGTQMFKVMAEVMSKDPLQPYVIMRDLLSHGYTMFPTGIPHVAIANASGRYLSK